jgi:aromatic ring-opening dioxygenase catalytic subunit (LigB family)
MAAGVPHAPYLPDMAASGGPSHRVSTLFRHVADELSEARPDVLVLVAPDHLVNFFFDNLPTFAVGLAARCDGPHETSTTMPRMQVSGDPALADALLRHLVAAGFDLARCGRVRLDHGLAVPLHFLTPELELPVVPLYVNAVAEPLPGAARCFDLGRAVRRFIDAGTAERRRIALVASGAFSLEIGGPRMGEADEAWLEEAADLISRGEHGELVRRATPQRLAAAGAESAELLAWIVVLGALDGRRPILCETDVRTRHSREAACYAAWRLS